MHTYVPMHTHIHKHTYMSLSTKMESRQRDMRSFPLALCIYILKVGF
jgi:hypothetical protein